MKRLQDIVKRPLQELTAFTDPPTVLIMRRKGIRLFPNGQRVATYKNDNLDLEVAIPYNPQTLGQHKIATIGTAVAEEKVDENSMPSDTLFGAYVHSTQLPGRPKAHNLLNHVETRYGEKAAGHLKAAATHYAAGETELANHHYSKFKHQASLVGEEFMDEAYNPDAVEKAIKASKPKIGSRERIAIHRLLKGRHGDPTTHGPKEHPVSKPMKALLTGEETIVEATIHSLHSIAKSKTPATVRFKNGSNAMVHHGTAARIMRLHSLMRKHNKRKVEALVNSSPDGLKKVVDFVDVHLK